MLLPNVNRFGQKAAVTCETYDETLLTHVPMFTAALASACGFVLAAGKLRARAWHAIGLFF